MENTPPVLAANAMTMVFALLLIASVVLKSWLSSRQVRHVARHRNTVPAAFAAQMPLEAHQKAADYTIAQQRLGLLEITWSSAVLLGWTLMGGLHTLNLLTLQWLPPGLWQQLVLLVGFALIGSLLDLPFGLYRTFVLEQRFGFNRMTWKLWLQDGIKGLLVGAVVGLPLAALVLWMMGAAGTWWWLWTWGIWTAFNLLMMVIYPTWIAPLFNRFEPLQDEVLRKRVTALMQRCGFTAQGLYVMDSSRRSAHANAYFTGLGRSKRVVFYDTLLKQLSVDEVEAVLAHELGHFSRKHIPKRMVSLFAMSLLGFALLGWICQQTWFYTGLGVLPLPGDPNDALALLLLGMVLPLASSFISPVMAQFSRKHEFEADAYAAEHARSQALESALLKLYQDNASTLTPDPVYVRFYYSHPPASERLGRLPHRAAGTPEATGASA
ncbi:M48 family metallopeptidase [Curvibacter sp. CHRR-16]|uniref:M48 family metallopeptidase n=1 Tax=Curvibacter sp. CHRR-16 TaxID=2835872 RepID=UPI001BD99088|nr:M48 family metallopeptidase [Curvibacter sp. CHRR-16]MBT0568707.1 M48 family metallopeptidase [Curvibacter sp. CHRR-16]